MSILKKCKKLMNMSSMEFDLQNKSLLHTQQLHEKVAIFYRYKMRKKISTTLPSVIMEILRFEQFYLVSSWVSPI
jgi:hypothetical protein